MKYLSAFALTLLLIGSGFAAQQKNEPLIPVSKGNAIQWRKLDLKINEGEKITDFELCDLLGSPVKTEDLRKGKVLVIRFTQHHLTQEIEKFQEFNELAMEFPNFFNQNQTKVLNRLAKDFPAEAVVLDIVTAEEKNNQVILDEYNKAEALFNIVVDPKGMAAELFGVTKLPSILIFDQDGKLRASGQIIMLYEDVARIIKECSQEKEKQQ